MNLLQTLLLVTLALIALSMDKPKYYECSPGGFGYKCALTCHCNSSCLKTNGSCCINDGGTCKVIDPVSLCRPHYYGRSCQAYSFASSVYSLQNNGSQLYPGEELNGSLDYAFDGMTVGNLTMSTEGDEVGVSLIWKTPKRVKFVRIIVDESEKNRLLTHATYGVLPKAFLGQPGAPTPCTFREANIATSTYPYEIRIDCPNTPTFKEFHFQKSMVNLTEVQYDGIGTNVTRVSFFELQLFQCLERTWGPDCEFESVTNCYGGPDYISWDTGQCETTPCNFGYDSPLDGNNTHCTRYYRTTVVAPQHVYVGLQYMLVFSIYRIGYRSPQAYLDYESRLVNNYAFENYHLVSSSGYSDIGKPLFDKTSDQVWVSIVEARDIGDRILNTSNITVPSDLEFTMHSYLDPTTILMVKLPVWNEGINDTSCQDADGVTCPTTYPACLSANFMSCNRSCGLCWKQGMGKITINAGLDNGTLTFDSKLEGLRTNPPAFVDFSTAERCFEENPTIIGVGDSEQFPVVATEDMPILFLSYKPFQNCSPGQDNVFYRWRAFRMENLYGMWLPVRYRYYEKNVPVLFLDVVGLNPALYIVECEAIFSLPGGKRREIAKGFIRVSSVEPVPQRFKGVLIDQDVRNYVINSTIQLTVNASLSHDPDGIVPSHELSYLWFCQSLLHYGCNIGLNYPNNPDFNDVLRLNKSDDIIVFPENTLRNYERFFFSVTIFHPQYSHRVSKPVQRIVLVFDTPHLIRIDCHFNCQWKVNPERDLLLAAPFIDLYLRQYRFEIRVEGVDKTNDLINPVANSPLGLKDYRDIFISRDYFQVNKTYNITLVVFDKYAIIGTAWELYVTNSPPTMGSCTIDPPEGFAMLTLFTVDCQGFYDEDEPLEYKMVAMVGTKEMEIYTGENSTFVVQLPIGEGQDFMADLKVKVSDNLTLTTVYNFNATSRKPDAGDWKIWSQYPLPTFCQPPNKAYHHNCMICPAGFQPPDCIPCAEGRYGYNCSLECACNSGCHKSNGTCLDESQGCMEANFSGPSCSRDSTFSNVTCKSGHTNVGSSCTELCPLRCKNQVCEEGTFICTEGCEDGYFGDFCNKKCKVGTFGANCHLHCHCSSFCNQVDGSCAESNDFFTHCQKNYYGPTCQAYNFASYVFQRENMGSSLNPGTSVNPAHKFEYAFDGIPGGINYASTYNANNEAGVTVKWSKSRRVKFLIIYLTRLGQLHIAESSSYQAFLGQPSTPTLCTFVETVNLSSIYPYKMRANCPSTAYHKEFHIKITKYQVHFAFYELQLYECSPGTWGPSCEYQCQTHCLNSPHCNWDTGECDQGCAEDWDSQAKNNTDCTGYTKNSVVAPSHAYPNQSMLVFGVYRYNPGELPEFYHFVSSSGQTSTEECEKRLFDTTTGQIWMSLQEARELGTRIASSVHLAVPDNLSFSVYNYSDPITILLKIIPSWNPGMNDSTCIDDPLETCPTTYPDCLNTDIYNCNRSCGLCWSKDLDKITINTGLCDCSGSNCTNSTMFRTNPPAFVNVTIIGRCFENSVLLIGAGDSEELSASYSPSEDIYLFLSYKMLENCSLESGIEFIWSVRQQHIPIQGLKIPRKSVFNSSEPILLIPANTLSLDGVYYVECEMIISTADGKRREYVAGFLNINSSLPMAIPLEGGIVDQSRYIHSWNDPLSIDASLSQDTEGMEGPQNFFYLWYCTKADNQSCNLHQIPRINRNNRLIVNNVSFVIAPRTLDKNEFYTFTLLVTLFSSTRRLSVAVKREILVLEDPSSPFEVICYQNCLQKINPEEDLALKVDLNFTNVFYCMWEIFVDGKEDNAGLENTSPTGRFRRDLVVKSNFFEPRKKYIIVAHVTITLGFLGKVGYYTTANSPPSGGNCSINPEEGLAYNTSFTINCRNFYDEDKPVEYKLLLLDGTREWSLFTGANKTIDLKLPVGDGENSTVSLKMQIYDRYKMATNVKLTAIVKLPEGIDFDLLRALASELDVLGSLISGSGSTLSWDVLLRLALAARAIHYDYSSDYRGNKTSRRNELRQNLMSMVMDNAGINDLDFLATKASLTDILLEDASEFDDDVKDSSIDLVHSLGTSLESVTKYSARVTKYVSTDILNSVGTLIEAYDSQLPDDAEEGVKAKTRTNKKKILSSLGAVTGVLSNITLLKIEPLQVENKALTLVVEKNYGNFLGNHNVTVTRETRNSTNSTIVVKFPDTATLENSSSVLGDPNFICTSQVMALDVNPYNWDESAKDVNIPLIADIAIKSESQEEIQVENLISFAELDFFTGGHAWEIQRKEILVTLYNVPGTNATRITSSKVLRLKLSPEENQLMILRVFDVDMNVTLMGLVSESREMITRDNVMQNGVQIPRLNNTSFNESGGEAYIMMVDNTTAEMYLGFTAVEGQNLSTVELWDTLSDQLECNSSESCQPVMTTNITVTFGIYTAGCAYYNSTTESWSPEGCQLQLLDPVNLDKLRCLCSHLSVFSAGILIVPNEVDPIADAKLFLTFFSNPVIVSTVVGIWVIYFLLLVWARRLDKREFSKAGVISLADNREEDKYCYVIGIVTGWWRHAGTSSTVYLRLCGAEAQSTTHCMTGGSAEHFKAGQEDLFLLTTMSPLGDIKKVIVWHDNCGSTPAWYLKHIIVRDVQTDKVRHFIYNDWLDLERGLKADIPALTTDELKQHKAYQLGLKSVRDLQTNHLYVSIVSCPPGSTFTRAQRLSVALSLLLLTMLTSLMFHGIPTDNPEDQLDQFGISISLADLMIGVQSGLIMFPINILIMQLFFKIQPKHAKTHDTIQEHDKCKGSNHGVTESGQSATDDETKPKKTKPPLRLPWWFVYIAWVLVIGVSITASYFVMLYGLKYGYKKSVDWMVSFFTAFFQSALVTQPLKVFFVAMFFVIILKKPVEFENVTETEEVDLQEDEELITEEPELKQHTETFIKRLPAKKAIESLKEKFRLESKIAGIIRNLIVYFTFVAVVLIVVHGKNDVDSKFYATNTIQDMLMEGKYEGGMRIAEVTSTAKIWLYLSSVVAPNIYVGKGLPTSSDVNYLLGTARLRQKRIQTETCVYPEVMAYHFALTECVDDFSAGVEDDKHYKSSWNVSMSQSPSVVDEWTFQSAWQLKTVPYMGKLATYSGGGYVKEFPAQRPGVLQTLKDLKDSDWVDRRTKALFIELSLYNPNVNLFSVVMMLFEFSTTGAVFPHYQIFTSSLYQYQNGLEIFAAVCEGSFLLYLLYFTYEEIKKYRKVGRAEYFADRWNIVELIIIALSFSAVGLFFERLVSTNNVIDDFLKAKQTSFTSFYTAVSWDYIFSYIMAFLVFFVILKALKLFEFNPRTNLLTETLKLSGKPIMGFMMIIAIAAIAFAHCAYLIFGSLLLDYSDFLATLMTLFNFALGVSDYYSLDSANRILGPWFYFTYSFLFIYILMVVFVAVLLGGFHAAVLRYRDSKDDIPVTWYIYDYIVNVIGFKRR